VIMRGKILPYNVRVDRIAQVIDNVR